MIDPDPITFTSSSSVSIVENTTDVITLRASGGGPDGGDTQKYTFSIDNTFGDGNLFEIIQSDDRYASISFKNLPDFELLSPAAEDNLYTVRVSVVEDIFYDSTTQVIAINVTNENDHSPYVASEIPDIYTNERETFEWHMSNNFSDLDSEEALTYSAVQSNGSTLPQWLSIDSTTGVLSATTSNGDDGVYEIKVTAQDSGNETISDTFNISVNNSIVNGTGGDDLIDARSASSVEAGAGTDTAVFSGNYADYTFSQSDSYVPLITNNTTNQVASLHSVERLSFNDGIVEIIDAEKGGEVRVNTTYFGDQQDVSIATLSNGNYVAVWSGSGDGVLDADGNLVKSGDNNGIFAQQYDPLGNSIGDEFIVNSNHSDWVSFAQSNPDIASIDNGFVIVWDGTGVYNSGSLLDQYGIFGQLYDLNGDAINDGFRVNTSSGYEQHKQENPSVVSLDNGGFIVSWDSKYQDHSSGKGLFAQIYNSSGVVTGSEFQINTLEYGDQDYVDTCVLSNGNVALVWTSDESGSANDSLYSKIIDSSGETIVEDFKIASSINDEASISNLSNGGFVVTYNDLPDASGRNNVYAQIFNPNGLQINDTLKVNTYTAGSKNHSDSVTLDSGNFVVIWNSWSQDGDHYYGIFGQIIDVNDGVIGEEFHVNTYTHYSQEIPTVEATSDGGFVVGWQSYGQDAYNTNGIYLQKFNAQGEPINEVVLNAVPNINSTSIASIDEDALYSYIFDVTDADSNDTVVLELASKPNWLNFDASTGVLSGTPDNGDVGTHAVILKATDAASTDPANQLIDTTIVTQEFEITVNNTNDNPIVASDVKDSYTYEDIVYKYDASSNFSDDDTINGDVLSYSALLADDSILPDWISINSTTGVISGTPSQSDVDELDIKITATDEEGVSVSDTYRLSIRDIVHGTSGNDTLNIIPETSHVYGYKGVDTLTLDGNYADYAFSQSESYISIVTNNTSNQSVSLHSVEKVEFDDGTVEILDLNNIGEYAINSYTANDQQNADLTELTNNGYVYVWESYNQDGSYTGIYGQLYDANGSRVNEEFLVNTYTDNRQDNPSIESLSDGFVVSWASNNQVSSNSNYDVISQKYDIYGNKIDQEVQVNSYIENSQTTPFILNMDGDIVILWTSDASSNPIDNSNWGVFSQSLDSNLNFVNSENLVNTTIRGSQEDPKADSFSNGNYVVVWDAINQDGDGWGVYGSIFNSENTNISGEFLINTTTYREQSQSDVATLDNSYFVVSWFGNGSGDQAGVYAKLFDSNSTVIKDEFLVNTETSQYQRSPVVSSLDDGFIIAWNSQYQDSYVRQWGVYAQRFNQDGSKNGEEFLVNTTVDSDQYVTDVDRLSDGGFVITWQSYGQDGSVYGIYSQRYNADGKALGEVVLNVIPEITSTAITTVNEDNEYSYQFTVDDLDALDAVSLSADSIPSWLIFDASTGILSGTPTNDDVGIHNIILNSAIVQQVTDDVNLAQEFTITVANTNDAPTVSTAVTDVSTNEDAVYSYDASANFTDVDTGDTATYTATLADDSALPDWLTITSAGVLSGTPLNANVGAIEVKVTRTDTAGESASDTFTLTIDDTNDAPVAATSPQITMNTSLGTIVFELNAELAPITVENILNYVNSGFYDDTLFHRVIPDFMVQGGGFTTGMVNSPTNDPIILESDNGLSNLRGTIAMARTSTPDSATSQFYINLVDNSFLDYQSVSNPGYAVFGEVISGLSVIDSIAQVSTTTVGGYQDVPLTDVVISSFQQTSLGQISDTSTNEDTAYSYDASDHFTDVDAGDALTYSAVVDNGDSTTSDLPTWLSIDPTTGVLSGTPDNGDVGSLDIKVSATDIQSQSASDTFTLTVDNTNDAPTLSGVFVGSIVEGDTNNLVNTVVIDDVDIDDVLDISLDTLIGNYGSVSFSSNFEWTYILDNNNTDVISLSSGETLVDTFELSASDGIETTIQDINITVQGKDAIFKIGILSPQTIDTNNPNIDLTLNSDEIVADAMIKSGYTSSVGLTSFWNTNTNTLILSFDSAINDSLSLIENMPAISLDDIDNAFEAELQQAGINNIQGFSFVYDEDQHYMEIRFDSATGNGVTISNYILHAEINPSTKLIEISGSAYSSSAGNIVISNSDLSSDELESFTVLLTMLDAIATVDLTSTDAIALFGLSSVGYSDIEGLSSTWDSSSNTLTINVDSAKYEDRIINDAKIVSVSNANGDITSYNSQAIVYGADPTLSQAEISDVVLFVLGKLGYSSISGFTSNWVTSNDVLTINMDGAYLSGTGSITNVSMVLDLNTSGDVSSYSGQAYSPYYAQWGYLTKSDLTTLELAAIKQTYLAIDALEKIGSQSTSNDVALIALKVLGYEQISGLTTSWDRENLTSTIEVDSAVLDGNVITNAKIIASTNSSGNIDYYSSTGTVLSQYGYTYAVSYDQDDLNDAEKFVVQAGNYAMTEINGALQTFNKYSLSDVELIVIESGHEILTEIDRITSNHNFTNGSATIVFNDDGSIKSYDASIDHSDVGTIVGTIADLDASELSIVEGVYTEISTIESMVANVQSATSMEDIAKVTLEYTGWSDLTNIAVNWDDDTSTATITFDGLFEGEQRTNPTFVISAGSDGEPTAFSYTAGSQNGYIQLDLAHLNDLQLYGNKVVMKAISDLYDLEQAANHTSKLTNNISFDLYKEGTDTNQDLIIDNGELHINENYSFDTVKISDASNYTQDINISDAIDVLRHIVDLESFTSGSAGYHAADVNNDGKINISDAIDILRHIVDLETIDGFDLIDETGNRLNTLDPTALGNAPQWMIVANGDVNMSGEFDTTYVMADIV